MPVSSKTCRVIPSIVARNPQVLRELAGSQRTLSKVMPDKYKLMRGVMIDIISEELAKKNISK